MEPTKNSASKFWGMMVIAAGISMYAALIIGVYFSVTFKDSWLGFAILALAFVAILFFIYCGAKQAKADGYNVKPPSQEEINEYTRNLL
jgi:hypothetical protein